MAETLLFRGGPSNDIAVSNVQSREIVIDTDTDQIVSGTSKKKTVMEDSNGDVEIGGGSVQLRDDGSSKFVGDMGLGNSAPNVKLAISVQSSGRTEDGIDFTNASGNNVYSSIRAIALSNELYFANRTAGKTLYIEKLGHVLIGGTLPSVPAIRLNASGSAVFVGDITITDNSKGLVLKSPDGTSFRLSVANDGTLSASSI